MFVCVQWVDMGQLSPEAAADLICHSCSQAEHTGVKVAVRPTSLFDLIDSSGVDVARQPRVQTGRGRGGLWRLRVTK